MKRLVIADIHSNNNNGVCTGHYFAVADMYVSLFDSICDVRVCSGPIYRSHFRQQERMIMLPYDMNAQGNFLLARLRALLNARSLFSQCRKDTVVLQDGRALTNHLGILLFCPKNMDLYLVKYTTKGIQKWYEKLVFRLIRNRIKGIICPNETVAEAFGLPSCIVPDYIYTKASQQNSPVPYESKRYDFCVVGRLNRDKGVSETIRFFADKPYSLLVAGQASSWDNYGLELAETAKGHDNIDLRLGYVSDEDYAEYIRQSRYCVLNYQGEYSNRSSGVVYDIIFSGVPVIGRSCKALDFVREHGLGSLYDSFESLDLQNTVSKDGYMQMTENIRTYLETHRKHQMNLQSFLGLQK